MASDEEGRRVVSLWDELKSERSNFEAQWDRLRKLFTPQRRSYVTDDMTQGQRDRRTTVNLMGAQAVNDLTAFTMGALINPQSDWFALRLSGRLGDVTPDELEWLDNASQAILLALHDPHGYFEQSQKAVLRERYAIGNGCMYIGDRPGKLPVYRHAPMNDLCWDHDGDGEVDTFVWRHPYTAMQAVKHFGKDLVDEAVRQAAEDPRSARREYEYFHVCQPNKDYDAGSEAPPASRYVMRWVEKQSGKVLLQGYSRQSCYTAYRGELSQPADRYGIGPADLALEDVSMAQRITVAGIRALEKAGDPPYIVPDDGVVSGATHESRGQIIVRADMMRSGNSPIHQLDAKGRPDLTIDFVQQMEVAVRRRFALDKINLPREPRMPVQHVIALREEQARDTAPLLSEHLPALGHVIERTAELMWRANRIPPLPNTVEGDGTVAVEFESPIVRAMRLAHTRAFMETLEAAQLAVQFDPAVRFSVKWADGIRDMAKVTGVRTVLIAGNDEMKQATAMLNKQAAQKDQLETGKDLSTMAKNAAPAMEAAGGLAGNEAMAPPPDMKQLMRAA